MNLPNKLTVLRVFLVPVFVALLLCNIGIPFQKWIALAVFIIACVTDALDGKIARKKNLVTNFGRFMDPVADKLLVCSALICFIPTGQIWTWIVLIIIARELIIDGFRLVAAEQGVVIAAGMWGKIKTTVQMIMICFLIGNVDHPVFDVIEKVLIGASLVLSIVSLSEYLIKNRNVLKEKNI